MITNVASPCIRICTLNKDDLCIGCLRTLDEISRWSSANSEQRLHILESIAERRREESDSS
ncbi:MAG TPA: DUF1289 domain-containing protein [Gammaproteobacteria bacterium]|nr:DUF1289 domain-containing protein [Gammaproteobacteria bacterium]